MTAMLEKFIHIFPLIFWRYLIIVGLAFLLLYVLFKKRLAYRKIQLTFPKFKDYRREFLNSMVSIFFFALLIVPLLLPPLRQFNTVFKDFATMPVWYHALSFILMLIMHDTYFYWMHRAMHHPKTFKRAHWVHHKSTNPSPWAALSFHPIEAFFEALIAPIIMLTLPVHVTVFMAFFFFQIAYSVYGHSGFEFYPKNFNKHWLGKWLNTSVHHNLHHKYGTQSYGLYFTFWDRMMGTMHTKYDNSYEELKNRSPFVSSE